METRAFGTLRRRGDIILEQLEERIVLDGAVEEASVEGCGCPEEGTGIFDGSVSKVGGEYFLFFEQKGFWWKDGDWQWAFDYDAEMWWENAGSQGWSQFASSGDFEDFARQGLLPFDGDVHKVNEELKQSYVYFEDKGWWWYDNDWQWAYDYSDGQWWKSEVDLLSGAKWDEFGSAGASSIFMYDGEFHQTGAKEWFILHGDTGYWWSNGSWDRAYDYGSEESWVFDNGAWLSAEQRAAQLVADIRPGENDSNPSMLTAYDGSLYFAADDGIHGRELWRYDPQSDRAYMTADIAAGAQNSNPGGLVGWNGLLYFFGYETVDMTTGAPIIWQYDPVTEAVDQVNQTALPTGLISEMTEVDGELYFTFCSGPMQPHELWICDPNTGLVERAVDVNQTIPDGHVTQLSVFNGSLIFTVGQSEADGLWRYDPAIDAADHLASGSGPIIGEAAGDLYFMSDSDLWFYDPDSGGAAMAISAFSPMDFAVVNDDIYLLQNSFQQVSEDGWQWYNSIWRYDTDTGAGDVVYENFVGGDGFRIDFLYSFDGALYFHADASFRHVDEIHGYDPLTGDTRLVTNAAADFNSGKYGGYSMVECEGRLYFVGVDDDHGIELWRV